MIIAMDETQSALAAELAAFGYDIVDLYHYTSGVDAIVYTRQFSPRHIKMYHRPTMGGLASLGILMLHASNKSAEEIHLMLQARNSSFFG